MQVDDLSNELKSLKDQLRLAEGAATKEVEAAAEMRRDFEIQMGNLETEVDKWKLLHESLYLQVSWFHYSSLFMLEFSISWPKEHFFRNF